MKYLAIFIGLVLVLPVSGQRKKKDDELEAPVYTEGIIYSLPRTGIKVYIEVVNETFVPGPYANYAQQLLGINDVKTRPYSKWEITEVALETFSEPDPNQVYKAMGDAGNLVSLTTDGRLSGINTSGTTTEIHENIFSDFLKKPQLADDFSFDYFTDTPFYEPGDSTNNFQPVRVKSEQKAAEAAERVLDCRANQYYMSIGMLDELHPDGQAYKISMDELKTIEKNYLSLFTGHTAHRKENFTFSFIPEDTSGRGNVIFRISDEKGVVPASDLSGKPVLIEVIPEQGFTQKFKELAKSENPAAGESGVFYRLPGRGTVNLIYELNTIASQRITIAQFGEIAPLPEDFLYGEHAVEIHPETGTIKSVTIK